MHRILMPLAVPLSALALEAAVALEARAEPSDADRATARALARQGYEAQQRQQYALAADRFERAEALVHAPTLLLGLARAEAGMDKVVEASETYRRILREPLAPHAPEAFAKAVAEAKKEAAQVERRLAWVTLVVAGAENPQVKLDDAPIEAVELGVPVACNPGTHTVSVSAPGSAPETRTFTANDSSRQTLTIALRAEGASQPVVALPIPSPPSSRPPRDGARVAAEATAFGIGGAGLVVGAVAGVYTLLRHHDLEGECPSGHCPAGESGALSTYRTVADTATVAAIVGAAGVAAGITLVLTAPKDNGLEAYAGPLGAGITGRF